MNKTTSRKITKEHAVKSWLGLVYLVAFVLELVALFFVISISRAITESTLVHVVLALVIGVFLIWFWGQYMAPKGKRRLPKNKYYIAKLIIYSIATYSIFLFTDYIWAGLFAVIALIDELILFRLRDKDIIAYFKQG